MAGPHWSLLGYEPGEADIASRLGLRIHHIGKGEALLDRDGHFRDAYGAKPGDWILVRPDGYVGAIVDAANADTLNTYLNAMGMAAAVTEAPAPAPKADIAAPPSQPPRALAKKRASRWSWLWR